MKTSKTILNIAIGTMLAASTTMAMAQADNVRLEGTTAIVPNAGNALERELTPALREQARKIAILENKKLDLEIEKVDLDIVKTQQESLTISNPVSSFGGSMGGAMGGRGNTSIPTPIDTSSLSNKPLSGVSSPQPMLTQTSSAATKKENLNGEAIDNSDRSIRVLMIGGNEGNLKAKIMYKRQGGYSVGQGDTLPNGKKVVRVDSQFIEVVAPKGKTKTKIYVSGYPTEAEEKAFALSGYSENSVTDSATPPASMPGMANSIPSPFGVPMAGIPTIATPALGTGRLTPMGSNGLAPGQVR